MSNDENAKKPHQGHILTHADRVKGGKIAGQLNKHHLIHDGSVSHKFTREEHRRGGYASIGNLKPGRGFTPEAIEKGWRRSIEVRKERKLLKEELMILLDTEDKNGTTVQTKMSFALIKKAVNGDTHAFEVIRDTIGQRPTEEVTIDIDKNKLEAIELLKNIKAMKGVGQDVDETKSETN